MSDLLAIEGGQACWPEGPPSWPPHDVEVAEALRRAAADGSWGRYDGPHGERLVGQLSARFALRHVLLCCSGTLAVELALRGLQVEGGEVVLAGYDFPGNFRAIEAAGARPVLVDLEPGGWRVSPDSFRRAMGPRTKAVLVSHLHGDLAEMRAIAAVAAAHDVPVVEDACQACGAELPEGPAGGLADVGVLSFGGSKILSAGRGGAILTDRAEVFQRAKIFCERGNHAFPLSELQAAVLVPQLDKLDERNATRRARAERLLDACGPLRAMRPVAWSAARRPAFYKLAFDLAEGAARGRDELVAAARAEGLALDAGFRGFHRRSAKRCRATEPLDESRRASERTVLLHHPILLTDEPTIDRAADALRRLDRWVMRASR